jgi:hypothetical protein
MILAVDESGSFAQDSGRLSFFVMVHLRQRKTLYKSKRAAFERWQRTLPASLKNAKGEIKGSALSEEHLEGFARQVMRAHPQVGITALAIRPSENPPAVVEKHRTVQLTGIRDGSRLYAEQGKKDLALTYENFGHWFAKLSYPQYLKLNLLGLCMASGLVNTVGHAVTGGYDEELVRTMFLLDRDFVKAPEQHIFWREVLRSQLFAFTKNDPLPLLDKWKKKGHPFLMKYAPEGRLNFAELFQEWCSFVDSRDYLEIRIADIAATIISRCLNDGTCRGAYDLIERSIMRNGRVHHFTFVDFDLSTYRHDRSRNPWLKHSETPGPGI